MSGAVTWSHSPGKKLEMRPAGSPKACKRASFLVLHSDRDVRVRGDLTVLNFLNAGWYRCIWDTMCGAASHW